MSELRNSSCTNLYSHHQVTRVLIPLAYSVICLVGLLGNSLALQVIYTKLTKLNSSTLYSANLAMSDLLFCLALPLRAIYYGLGFHWPMGEGLCKAVALLFYLNSYAGVNFMTCLAVDRFVSVALRPKCVWLRKIRNVKLICLLMWVLVLAQTLPLLSMQMTREEHDGKITCMEYPNFEQTVQGLPYMLIGAVVLGYGIPLGTILLCYSALSHRLRQAAKSNRLTERSGRTHRARTLIAGVVLVFVVCFSPYHIDLLQYMIRKLVYEPNCEELHSFQISLHITVCLMNFNACLDPFVYFFSCSGYKNKVLNLLKRHISPTLSSAAPNTTASARISACLADISSWMTAHQLKLNPSKTELLIIPGDPCPAQGLAISLSNSMISPSTTARNLGVTMDNQLSFSSHVTNVTRSCRFLLYNIRRIRPFLSTQATQVLVQSLVISRLDYCNSLLAGLPLNAIRPLQMIQNAAARLVFNLPNFSHTTPLLRSLHWLPVAARIRFKTLMLAYKAKNGPAPSYLKALITPHTAPRSLRSTSTARLIPPSLREKGSYTSRLFSVLAPSWWNELPLGIRTAESLTIFKRQLKTYLFLKYLNILDDEGSGWQHVHLQLKQEVNSLD
ncbi:hypothetical protein QTP86_009273 [Hemibagrus guttatus]|nr:hypothetical protein QTP86_009273 [Hemibagrus guttatus]